MKALIAVAILLVMAMPTASALTKDEHRELWLDKLGDVAWLLWLLAIVITHTPLTSNVFFRVIADLAILVLFAWPIYADQGLVLVGLTIAVLGIDIGLAINNARKPRAGGYRRPSFRTRS